MSEIKYEAVFGPQELFNNEFEPNAIAVIFIDRTNKLHATSEAEIDRQLQRTGSLSAGRGKIRRSGGCRKLGLSADKATRMRLL